MTAMELDYWEIGKVDGKDGVMAMFKDCYVKMNFVNSSGGSLFGYGSGTKAITMQNCYWSGTRSSEFMDDRAYSLVWTKDTGIKELTNSYFDKTKFPKGIHNGIGLTTEEMGKESSYEGWDFDNTWYMGEDGLPELKFK